MGSELVETDSINVVLIGDNDEQINFIQAFNNKKTVRDGDAPYYTEIVTDTYDYNVYCIQHLTPESDKRRCLNNADAILYLNASSQEICEVEEIRCQNNSTIAIDFNSINLTAQTCLDKIEALQRYFLKNMDTHFKKKTSLVLSAHAYDNQSLFHFLPKEIIFNEIYEKYEKLATNKFVFFSCPPELAENPANQNKMDGKRL